MSYTPNNPNGQASEANSAPVVLDTTDSTNLSTIATNTTGASTAANQSTANTTLATIATNTTGVASAANQSTEIASLSTIATNSGTQATSALQSAGNTSLASIVTNTAGVATSANQATEISSLATIATNSGTQATAANQATANTSLSTIATNTTGAATATNQASGNTSLSTIATNSGIQATAANQTTGNTSLATIATNSGTQSTAANQTAVQGTVAAGTAATKSELIGGVFNTALPTLTTGQQAAVQLDSSGRQIMGSSAAVIGAVTQSGTWNVGTLTTLSTLTTLANGQTAHSSPSTGSPLRVAGRVNTTLDTTLIQGDASDLFISTSGQLIQKLYSTAENDWQSTSGTTALTSTTSTALKSAGAASIRNYCTALQLFNTSATVSATVSILDGATVIWTGFLPASTSSLPLVPLEITFPTPLKGTAATAMNIQLGTTSASVYYNVQGYQSF